MPAAYSYDLRKKAMEVLEEGERRETVAARFKIGKTTLWEWQQRKKETGDFQSKKLGNVGYIALFIIVQKAYRKAESTARRKDVNRGMFFLALFFYSKPMMLNFVKIGRIRR